MISKNLKKYLKDHNVHYETVEHRPAYTAQELAAITHVPGKNFAKTVVLRVDGKMVMFVEPANTRVNLETLRELMGAKKVELAHESDFQHEFPECETGAMAPFGELFHMDVYMAESMKDEKEIAFNAGNHSEIMKMSCKDYVDLVHPHWVNV